MDILTVKQICKSENDFLKTNPKINLMELAVNSLYQFFPKKYLKKKILIICGPGKNGLDGKNFYKLIDGKKKKLFLINETFDFSIFKSALKKTEIVIDSIFGIGLNRDIEGIHKEVIKSINRSKAKVFSFDIPSGINANSGKKFKYAVKADQTIAIGFYKPGHFLLPGKEYCGKLNLVKIGLKTDKIRFPKIKNINNNIISNNLPKYDLLVHKHKKGNVLVCGGEMAGAARLVALSARKVGAGLSTIEIKKKNLKYYTFVEVGTILSLQNKKKKKYSSVVIGPGYGINEKQKTVIDILKNYDVPFIIDADVFTIFSKNSNLLNNILSEKGNCVLTPHEGEFKRYFKFNKTDKISQTIEASKISNSIVIFKGNDTVIANPDGDVWINSNAGNNLATAGTGDVLCGIIAGLLSQGLSLKKASLTGVWIHGELSKNSNNVIVEDFLNEIPYVMNSLKY